MKKIVLGIALSVLMIGNAQAWSLVDLARQASRENVKAEVLVLETDGNNMRLYVFTAPFNKDYICIFTAGTQKGGAACYPKGKEVKKK